MNLILHHTNTHVLITRFLQSLLLGPVRLRVLERKSACALVKLVVPARHGSVAGKHDAVQSKGCKDSAADAAKEEACLARPGEAAIAVKGARYVVECGNKDCGGGIRRRRTVGSFCYLTC
jgi:hypothetical protein